MQFPLFNDAKLPQHHNFSNRGKTLFWSGSDTLERFRSNTNSSLRRSMFSDLGFSETSITYKYNPYGFRDEEFDDRPCGMAFGCSHTEGTGLPIEHTWPRVLGSLLGTWVWNLGVCGSSLDTVFRLMDFWLPYFNPKFVVVCEPHFDRVEVFDRGNPVTLTPLSHDPDFLANFYKVWTSTDDNMNIARRKNLLAIEKLCNDRNIPLIITDWNEIRGDANARDLMHTGASGNRRFAEKIKEKL